jgi:hypothetical protein
MIIRKNLDTICIRAQVNGKWGSHSLGELLDLGYGSTVMRWGIDSIRRNVIGIKEVEEVTEEHLQNLIEAMETLGIPIVKIKEEFLRSLKDGE